MASAYHIQKPYVLASLPRSLAQPDGTCVVGEIYGQRQGARRKRRPEVVVGIDGESANIYDVASARLITSYPVPPQAKFVCPPCSARLRSSAGKSAAVARYTYIATREPARKLSLFKDTVEASGATSSTTATASLGRTSDIVSLHLLSGGQSGVAADKAAATVTASDLIAVAQDGEVSCFDGESLKEKYKVSITALSQDLIPRGSVLGVEYAQIALASDVLKGLALGEDYFSGHFAQKINGDGGFDPDVLVVVTAVSGRQGGITRYLHVFAVDPDHQNRPTGHHSLAQVHYIRLPSSETTHAHHPAKNQPNYRLDTPSGSLSVLDGENVISYDLTRSIPRAVAAVSIPGITSFVRLSKSSILAATPTSFSVYNPFFKSLQASTSLDFQRSNKSEEAEGSGELYCSCSFLSFFGQLELAVALVDSNLVAVQLEPPRTRSRKRRADGLLIDSIGRGKSYTDAKAVDDAGSIPETSVLGTVSAAYLAQHKEDIQTADQLLEQNDISGFDGFLAEKLGIQDISEWRWQRPLDGPTAADTMDETEDGADTIVVNGLTNGLTNGTAERNGHATSETTKAIAHQVTPTAATERVKYPETDRRWIVYAIDRVLAVEQHRPGNRLRLGCKQPQSGILNYLVDAGNLSVANVRSALRNSLGDFDDTDLLLGEALPIMLTRVDPSLSLLVRWLYETQLGAAELLSAILLLMRSLELVGEAEPEATPATKLLTNGKAEDVNGDDSKTQELDLLDQQLHLAEYFLQHVENDPRDLALDIAIGKLGSCPAVATVQGMRRIFKTEEVRSLIEVLRQQLVNQGWATRYMDMEGEEEGGEEERSATPLNCSIRLIADLLCRCIDSVRPGEWLVNDEVLGEASAATAAAVAAANGDGFDFGANGGDQTSTGGDFFASLKWQVSAALEGVQEAMYLRGLLGEVVHYATNAQKISAAASRRAAHREQANSVLGNTIQIWPPPLAQGMLPLGLKGPAGKSDVTPTKVTSGGEVVKRSRREIGYLKSRQVGDYTLERIVF